MSKAAETHFAKRDENCSSQHRTNTVFVAKSHLLNSISGKMYCGHIYEFSFETSCGHVGREVIRKKDEAKTLTVWGYMTESGIENVHFFNRLLRFQINYVTLN
ncbi:hypothetical protein TNIN_147831 [Trichonephila inaurata madagascariensis]|uniref:Uncharacterized protein n=1 Tax=Trichonephila inaurata madagascariensis TaxID=2747483 RepID=A0A8X7C6Z4_9ARAC|nr:hypothetical protein TNIN_147831 [Trichonephila inaurata madagascariensis]